MATQISRRDFKTTIALILSVILVLSLACSGGDDDSDQVVEPTAAEVTEATATTEPDAPVVEPDPTEAPTATPPPAPTATPEPEIDPTEVTYFRISDSPAGIVPVNGELFVFSNSGGFVSRRTTSGESLGSPRGGREGVLDMTFDGENLWTADFSGSQVRKFSPDGDDLGKFDVKSPTGIEFDGSSIWVTNKDNHTVTKLSLDGDEIDVFEAGEFPEEIAFDGTDLWITNSLSESVTRLSTDGEVLASIYLGIGRAPIDIVADENYAWVSNGFNKLTRISTSSNEVRDFEVGRITGAGRGQTGGLALDDQSIYMTHRLGEKHGTVTQLSHEGVWISSVEVGGDNPTGVAVIDGTVFAGVDVGNEIAVISPEALAANTPVVPDGVTESVVQFDGSEHSLSGVLTMPTGSGDHPAVLLVSGSGENSGDMVFTFRWMRTISHYLAELGIASLRMDDRGIGGSGGDKLDTTITGRVADATNALEFLSTQNGIDAAKVGILGHSEGGTVSAAVAAESEVAFVVSLGGTVAPHSELLPLQAQRFLEADGSAESYVEGVLEDVAYAHNAILTGEGLEQLEREIALGSVVIVAPDYIQGDPQELITPWFQDFLKYDPQEAWSAVEEPVLALFGDKDWAVPAEQNEPLLTEILAASGNSNHHVQVINGTNHFFQHSESGAIGEIATNPREFVPGFLELIGDWITAQIDGE